MGSHFIKHVLEAEINCRVVNLDLLTYAGSLDNLRVVQSNPAYRFIMGDIGDSALIRQILTEERIEAVIHFAAESHVDRSIEQPELFVKTNILGTQVLLEESRKHWIAGIVKQFRFIQISTDEVYGSLDETGKFNEDSPLSPNSPYSASKAAGDLLVRAYNKTFGLPTIIARSSNNYGPHQFPEKLIPFAILKAIAGERLEIHGDGMSKRDWIHVKDNSMAIVTILQKGKVGEIYNVGSNNEWENIAVVNLICDLVDEKLERREGVSRQLVVSGLERPGHDRRYAIDASKLEEELGWHPQCTFVHGLTETINWYFENRDHLEPVLSRIYNA